MQQSFLGFVNFKSKLKSQMLEQFEDVIEEEKDEEELDQLKDFLQKIGVSESEWVDLDGEDAKGLREGLLQVVFESSQQVEDADDEFGLR